MKKLALMCLLATAATPAHADVTCQKYWFTRKRVAVVASKYAECAGAIHGLETAYGLPHRARHLWVIGFAQHFTHGTPPNCHYHLIAARATVRLFQRYREHCQRYRRFLEAFAPRR